MDDLNDVAIECNVTVIVTTAFRREDQGKDFVNIYQPNALIGQAIQFNLATPTQWCSDNCLRNPKNNLEAQCFMDKVKRSPKMEWKQVNE